MIAKALSIIVLIVFVNIISARWFSNFRSSSSLSSFRKTPFRNKPGGSFGRVNRPARAKPGWNIGRSARKPASVPKPPPIGRVDIPEPRAHKHPKAPGWNVDSLAAAPKQKNFQPKALGAPRKQGFKLRSQPAKHVHYQKGKLKVNLHQKIYHYGSAPKVHLHVHSTRPYSRGLYNYYSMPRFYFFDLSVPHNHHTSYYFFAGQSNNQHDKCKTLLKRIQEMDLTMQLSDLQRSCSVYDELEQSVCWSDKLNLACPNPKAYIEANKCLLKHRFAEKCNATEQMDCKQYMNLLMCEEPLIKEECGETSAQLPFRQLGQKTWPVSEDCYEMKQYISTYLSLSGWHLESDEEGSNSTDDAFPKTSTVGKPASNNNFKCSTLTELVVGLIIFSLLF